VAQTIGLLATLLWMWTVQFISEFGERDELSLAHLALRLFHQSALFWGEHIVGISHGSADPLLGGD
jgi:hypothetical protein